MYLTKEQIREVPCTTCGAGTGAPCEYQLGRGSVKAMKEGRNHQTRLQDAQEKHGATIKKRLGGKMEHLDIVNHEELLVGALLEIRDELAGLRKDLADRRIGGNIPLAHSLSTAQIKQLTEVVQEKLLEQAKKNPKTGLTLAKQPREDR